MTDKDLEILSLRGRINSLEILGKRYESALREICNPDQYGWRAEDMYAIAEASLAGRMVEHHG